MRSTKKAVRRIILKHYYETYMMRSYTHQFYTDVLDAFNKASEITLTLTDWCPFNSRYAVLYRDLQIEFDAERWMEEHKLLLLFTRILVGITMGICIAIILLMFYQNIYGGKL